MVSSPPRSAHRPAILAGALILAGACLLPGTTPGAARPDLGPAPASAFAHIGVNSCAARGCHGAVGGVEPGSGDVYIKGGAFTTWRGFDPHARAHDVLLDPRSVRIAANLRGPAAHESTLCLSCHATPAEAGSSAPRGIDCEGCHGPASKWGEAHVALDWISLKPAAKAASGFRDLSTPRARSESCVGCHVGDRSRGMEVDHDLIAAGHPRLNFEYASYLAALPKHWREETPAVDFEARSWAVGQAVTARAVLRLLDDRATAAIPPNSSSPWPEFAESECFACHHVPANPGERPFRDPKAIGPGRLPWATWTWAMLPVLASDRPEVLGPLAKLREEMSRAEPDPGKVAGLAREGRLALGSWIDRLDPSRFDARRVEGLIAELTRPEPGRVETWDESAQRSLAVEALARAWKDLGGAGLDPAAARLIESAPKRLAFPVDFDSPREGRPPAKP